jgi:hypothetical protein
MNDNSSDRRGACGYRRGARGRPRPHRAGLLAAAAGIALLATACGGTSGTSTAGTDTSFGGTHAQALAFAKCMRSHGVPQFPDPDGQGNFNAGQFDQFNQQDPQAFVACRSLLPGDGTGLTELQLQDVAQHNLKNAVKAAGCMRAHGIENFPDPAAGGSAQEGGGGVNWQPVLSAGLNLNTPSYEAAYHACAGTGVGGPIPPLLAPGAPSPAPGSGSGSGSG